MKIKKIKFLLFLLLIFAILFVGGICVLIDKNVEGLGIVLIAVSLIILFTVIDELLNKKS